MKFVFSFMFLLAGSILTAQQSYNMSLLGRLDYEQGLNDVWGYVDQLGNEYAIVGVLNGTSIVDVTNPSVPLEIAFVPGPTSIWRDMKTYKHFAYIVHDSFNGGESQGLLIIDLSDISNGNISTNTFLSLTYSRFHNIYIDENGVAYLFGGDYDNGGVLMYDLYTDPENPILLGSFEESYLHDGMVRGDTLWGSAVYEGLLMAIDVSDKSNPTILGTVSTPHNFTHNAWVSDDGNTVFTTDEVAGAFVAAVDVSDVTNMIVVDQIQSWSPETNVIPHNTHVKGKFLVTSYYCDGVTVVDASDPTNLQEVAYYDTSDSSGGTFSGAWGVYPFLPSGNILVSDRQEGLHILSIDDLEFPTDELSALLEIEIHPNPSADYFTIAIDSESWETLNVYDILGKLMETRLNTNSTNSITLGENWLEGTYILSIETKDNLRINYQLQKQ